jgi:preprotein translocase subunit SecF
MSDTVLVVLIMAVAIVVVLIVFRRRVSHFLFRADQQGVAAEMRTREDKATAADGQMDKTSRRRPADVTVRGVRQAGAGNEVEVSTTGQTADVEDIAQLGVKQKLKVEADQPDDASSPKP